MFLSVLTHLPQRGEEWGGGGLQQHDRDQSMGWEASLPRPPPQRGRARRAQQQVLSLQAENQSLQLHLEDTQRHCRQLEDTARTHTQ
ncbi:centriolin-like isoform X1, partial [Lates japonicus]